jgi:hypothetical protein
MIAGLIFGLSLLTLLQFFVSYCRSLIAGSQEHKLSEQALEICGFTARTVAGDHFGRLLQLVALCPNSGEDGMEIRAVTLYFRMLGMARILLSWAIPSVAPWIEAERGGCAYTAAVVLDRRIAYSRTMMAQQTSH